jgi:hypothetical protein
MTRENSFKEKFNEFINSDIDNCWIVSGQVKAYFRKSYRRIEEFDSGSLVLDLANVCSNRTESTKTGNLKIVFQLMESQNKYNVIFVENILNPRMDEILDKHDWGFVRSEIKGCPHSRYKILRR